jgi:hypothetical protein
LILIGAGALYILHFFKINIPNLQEYTAILLLIFLATAAAHLTTLGKKIEANAKSQIHNFTDIRSYFQQVSEFDGTFQVEIIDSSEKLFKELEIAVDTRAQTRIETLNLQTYIPPKTKMEAYARYYEALVRWSEDAPTRTLKRIMASPSGKTREKSEKLLESMKKDADRIEGYHLYVCSDLFEKELNVALVIIDRSEIFFSPVAPDSGVGDVQALHIKNKRIAEFFATKIFEFYLNRAKEHKPA